MRPDEGLGPHLDDGLIQAWIHEELSPAQRESVAHHLEDCARCAGRIREEVREEEELFELLETIDEAPPAVGIEAMVRRAGSGRRIPYRWAAGIVLTLTAAGAAYAAPGSPVRTWVDTILSRTAESPSPPPALPATQSADPTGIVLDVSDRLVIRFPTRQATGTIRVSIVEVAGVMVEATSGGAAFDSDLAELTVTVTEGSPSFRISIPPEAPLVEIWVGNELSFRKVDEQLEGGAEGPDPSTRVISLAGPG